MAKRPKPTAEEQKRRSMMMEVVRELGIDNANDLYTTLRDMFTGTMENMLIAVLDEHLGYEKHDQQPKQTEIRRNVTITKKVRTNNGELELHVPASVRER